jgi:hypothetical protein
MRFILSIALLALAGAFSGCSSTSAPAESASFCHGYIQKSLGEMPIEGVDRNLLWLSWNEVVKSTIFEDALVEPGFKEGRDTFSRQLAANDVAAMEEYTEGECDLSSNPLWVWW